MKLLGSFTSPYVRKARIAFLEKKIDVELVLEDVWSASSKISELNPLGKVPALIMDDGGVMFDSRVIVEYADTLSPVGHLIPSSGKDKAAVKTWEALCDGVLDAAILLRLEKTWAPRGDHRSQEWIDRQMGKMQVGLKAIADGLGNNQWCYNNQFGLADIAVGCVCSYFDFRFPDIAWRNEYPNLATYFDKLNQRPSFVETAPPTV
jgi:glutathione S-transferase